MHGTARDGRPAVNDIAIDRTSIVMNHTHLWLSALSIAFFGMSACDLPDKSIGDEGGMQGDDAGDDGGSGDTGNPGDDGPGCTLIGCDDFLSITLVHAGPTEGAWSVTIAAQDGSGDHGCTFTVDASGQIEDDTCNVVDIGTELVLYAPASWAAIDVSVTIDGIAVGSASETVAYTMVAPNGPECGPVCTQGNVDVPIGAPADATCEELEAAYVTELAAAQACTEAAECGQVLMAGGSCGCTRALVARLDHDVTQLETLWTTGEDMECAFQGVDGVCDCPAADGFACLGGVCTWNYL